MNNNWAPLALGWPTSEKISLANLVKKMTIFEKRLSLYAIIALKNNIFHFYSTLSEKSNNSLSAPGWVFLAQIRSHACKMGFKNGHFRKKRK